MPEMLAAEVLLRALKTAGVDHLFANPGTDFPSIVEAFARAGPGSAAVPRPVLATHETIAVTMAHGAHLATGRPQAAMLHVNVGTANALCSLINAQRDNIPLILAAGRTPITEAGPHGARTRPIHWAQEMFDQAGMLREIVKWDYELRRPDQAADAARRAVEIASAEPRGPVYLTLPREVLAGSAAAPAVRPPVATAPAVADPAALERLAGWIAEARAPVVVTSAAGRDPAVVPLLGALAAAGGIAVVEHSPRYLNLPHDHPCHAGFDPAPLLKDADLVLVVECDVPWIPHLYRPREDARIAHLGTDPLFQRYPMRTFRADLNLPGDLAHSLGSLARLLGERAPVGAPVRRRPAGAATAGADGRLTFEAASRAIHELIDDDTVIVNEYPLRLAHCPITRPGRYFGLSPAGGLGWGLGAALGYKLAAPDKFVVATLGDGAYIFANPVAGHTVAAAENLPILVVVFNNRRYGAVRMATLSMYGQGAAAADDGQLLARLDGTPDFAGIVRAHGGHGETVDDLAALPVALGRARQAVQGGRQALVDVRVVN